MAHLSSSMQDSSSFHCFSLKEMTSSRIKRYACVFDLFNCRNLCRNTCLHRWLFLAGGIVLVLVSFILPSKKPLLLLEYLLYFPGTTAVVFVVLNVADWSNTGLTTASKRWESLVLHLFMGVSNVIGILMTFVKLNFQQQDQERE